MSNSESDFIPPSELIINPDGSVYHIHLRKDQVATTILLVGDQDRVRRISQHFDEIEHKVQNREFVTHTGWYLGKRLTAMSTGIGTDNIDIVLNELDALFNVDFTTRQVIEHQTPLTFIRLGTSGALHEDIPVGTILVSEYGLGFDGLLHYYRYNPSDDEKMIQDALINQLGWNDQLSTPYLIASSRSLMDTLCDNISMVKGITATASGFYGPQGRSIRLPLQDDTMNERLANFNFKDHRVTNFEMETSGLYGLSKLLGHSACTCCAIIANRVTKDYSKDYKALVDDLIKNVLDQLVTM